MPCLSLHQINDISRNLRGHLRGQLRGYLRYSPTRFFSKLHFCFLFNILYQVDCQIYNHSFHRLVRSPVSNKNNIHLNLFKRCFPCLLVVFSISVLCDIWQIRRKEVEKPSALFTCFQHKMHIRSTVVQLYVYAPMEFSWNFYSAFIL